MIFAQQGLGCKMDKERCRTLTLVYDLDRSGFLEIEEFVTWMMLEHVKVSRLGDESKKRVSSIIMHSSK